MIFILLKENSIAKARELFENFLTIFSEYDLEERINSMCFAKTLDMEDHAQIIAFKKNFDKLKK